MKHADATDEQKIQPLNCDRDAARWAREFNDVLEKNDGHRLDEGWLISWFANAMMCGEDTYRWRQEARVSETVEINVPKVLEWLELFKDDEKAGRRLDWGWISLIEQELRATPSATVDPERDQIAEDGFARMAAAMENIPVGTPLKIRVPDPHAQFAYGQRDDKNDEGTIADLARAVLEHDSWSPTVVRMLAQAIVDREATPSATRANDDLVDLLRQARGELKMVTSTPKAMDRLPMTGPAIERLIPKIDAALREYVHGEVKNV